MKMGINSTPNKNKNLSGIDTQNKLLWRAYIMQFSRVYG